MQKLTLSLCPVCYLEIPAFITCGADGVVMSKECPSHGRFSALVERDPEFYLHWQRNNGPIYDGHLVDVTTRCNLACKYCYYAKGAEDIPMERILNECRTTRGPHILTGGEPTLRPDLPDLMARIVADVGAVMFLTNGVGLLDRAYLRECNRVVSKGGGWSGIGLSYHREFARFDEVVENLKAEGVKPMTCFFVIDELGQVDDVLAFAEMNRGMFDCVRIKCASDVWAQEGTTKIFASDVVSYIQQVRPGVRFAPAAKPVYVPLQVNGVTYAVVSWNDVHNVDLLDICCPPTYRAQTGEVADFVKAMLINEGMGKGWMKGRRI